MMNRLGYEPVECLQVPKILFRDPEYRKMSVEAKVLYALLLDRMNVAALNGWIDDYGTRYVIYPKSEMKKDLNATRYRVDMALEELYQKEKMVVVTQPYPGRPCQIYVKDITGKIEEDKNDMKRMMTQEKMKEFPRKESEENYDEKVVYDQSDFDEILKIEGSFGRLTGLIEIVKFALNQMRTYSGQNDGYFGLDELKEVLDKEEADVAAGLDGEDDFELCSPGEQNQKRQEAIIKGEIFKELYVRNMINDYGKLDSNVIRRRSTMCALSFFSVLIELDKKGVIDGDRLVEMIRTLYDCNDYDGVYDVLYIMKEIVNWGFEEMQDIEWLQRGDLRLLYIDGFMNALNQEIFETEEANLEVEDDKKEE